MRKQNERLFKPFLGVAAIVIGLVALAMALRGSAQADPLIFDENVYRQLVDANSPDTIPPGTRITLDNWRK